MARKGTNTISLRKRSMKTMNTNKIFHASAADPQHASLSNEL